MPTACSVGVRRSVSEADDSPPRNVEFKNGWSYNPTTFLRLHGVTGTTSRNLPVIQLLKIFPVSWTVRGVKNLQQTPSEM